MHVFGDQAYDTEEPIIVDDTCTTPNCPYPRDPDRFICRNCTQALRTDLRRIPDLLNQLDVTLARQTRMHPRNGPAGAEVPLVFNQAASEARWVLADTLTAWATALAEHLGQHRNHHGAPIAAAWWLHTNLANLTGHPDAGQAVDELAAAVDNVVRAIDTPTDQRTYLGMCGDVTGQTGCRGKVYAPPRAQHGRCDRCQAEHPVKTRRAVMLRHLSNQKITAPEIATLLRSLDIDIAVSDIQNAARTGRIIAVSTDAHRKRAYRVGDVLRTFLGAEAMKIPA